MSKSSAPPSFDSSWEREIFSQGLQANRYPFGELVSYVLRLYGAELKSGKKLRALELGCGTGNNIHFLCKEGFETFGIEGSASACETARKSLAAASLRAEITHGDFVNLPYEENYFDLVIDREAVYCNRKAAILSTAGEVRRCLKPGGRFLTFTYSVDHGAMKHDGGEMVEANTFNNFKKGVFQKTGVTHFFTEEEIRQEYLKGFEIEFMFHHRNDIILPEPRKNHYSEFVTCGIKPA